MDAEVQKRFYEFIAEFIRRGYDLDVERVVDVDEVSKASGYCDTCYNEWTEVNIYYIDSQGNSKVYDFCGTMGELFTQ